MDIEALALVPLSISAIPESIHIVILVHDFLHRDIHLSMMAMEQLTVMAMELTSPQRQLVHNMESLRMRALCQYESWIAQGLERMQE